MIPAVVIPSLAGAPWPAICVVAAFAVVLKFLSPCWTAREPRAGRLARHLKKAGLSSDQIASITQSALHRAAGDEELPPDPR